MAEGCLYTFPQFRGTGLNLWLKVSESILILKMARKVFRRLTFQKHEIIDKIIETGSAEFCGAHFYCLYCKHKTARRHLRTALIR